MELYASELDELVVKTKQKANYIEHYKSLTELIYQNLSLVEACELSRFTFDKVRLRCEEPQEDELDINTDFLSKRDQIDLILAQVETDSALQCKNVLQSEQKLLDKYDLNIASLKELEADLSTLKLNDSREQISKQIFTFTQLKNKCTDQIKEKEKFIKARTLKLR